MDPLVEKVGEWNIVRAELMVDLKALLQDLQNLYNVWGNKLPVLEEGRQSLPSSNNRAFVGVPDMCNNKPFLRLPDIELDYKYDAWPRLQKLLDADINQRIAHLPLPYPEWLIAIKGVIQDSSSRRDCCYLIRRVFKILEQTRDTRIEINISLEEKPWLATQMI